MNIIEEYKNPIPQISTINIHHKQKKVYPDITIVLTLIYRLPFHNKILINVSPTDKYPDIKKYKSDTEPFKPSTKDAQSPPWQANQKMTLRVYYT